MTLSPNGTVTVVQLSVPSFHKHLLPIDAVALFWITDTWTTILNLLFKYSAFTRCFISSLSLVHMNPRPSVCKKFSASPDIISRIEVFIKVFKTVVEVLTAGSILYVFSYRIRGSSVVSDLLLSSSFFAICGDFITFLTNDEKRLKRGSFVSMLASSNAVTIQVNGKKSIWADIDLVTLIVKFLLFLV